MKRILIVDDAATVRMYHRAILEAAGYAVEEAVNGIEALEKALTAAYDLYLVDVNMPKMDGWQLLRLLRTKPQFATVPLLFTTTLSSEADRLRGYRLGVDDYLAKPFRVGELRARVHRLLARVPARQSVPQVAPPAARSLHGDLAHVSLASVLGLFELERRTGRLTAQEDTTGVVTLRDGLLVDAVVEGGRIRGKEALFVMLGWSRGDFDFVLCDVPGERGAGMHLSALLLEHAQRSDERNR